MAIRDAASSDRAVTAAAPVPAVTPLRPMGSLSVSASVDDADSPRDILDLLALDAFVAGREPFARSVYLEDVTADASFLPAAARLLREAIEDDCVTRLAASDGWTVRAKHYRGSRRAHVLVTATSPDLAAAVLAEATAGAVEMLPASADRVPIGFWHRSAHGPLRVSRDIETPEWQHIRGNYTARVAAAGDRLMALDPLTVPGRLLLLHGPPGTGKTTFLRALADRWRDWCQVDCVLDPERLFADPGYLMEVALGAESADGERWRMLLLEDCDELIRTEAKASTGQALSRLLNLTDGLLGQGRHVIVTITTNEDLTSLHPAVTRPGRSLAHVEVGRFGAPEAEAWLATHAPGVRLGSLAALDNGRRGYDAARDGASLAELIALRSQAHSVTVVEDAPVIGGYL
jgi:hypothetical protein